MNTNSIALFISSRQFLSAKFQNSPPTPITLRIATSLRKYRIKCIKLEVKFIEVLEKFWVKLSKYGKRVFYENFDEIRKNFREFYKIMRNTFNKIFKNR